MMRYRMHNRGDFLRGNAKSTIAAVLVLCLSFSEAVVKADWKSDANARIESIRKRNAQITVLGSGGQPINGVSVEIEQIKHRFGFGTAIPYGLLSSSSNYRNFVLDHFEWAVCENEMKWGSNESTRDSENYTQADYIANWCTNNDIKLRGHCIAWEQPNSQMPQWLKDLVGCSEMPAEVNERIDSIVNRYKGKIVSWDVDNEMLSDDFFGTCLGESGRANMFNRANQIDPNCGMYMNEYRGNSFGGYDGDEYVARASSLINTYGAQIEGLGIQAHINSPFQPESYYNNVLNELDNLGLPIIATEFDTDAGTATQVADDLENFYRICFSHPNVEGIIMWGCEQSAWRWDGIVNSSTWVLNAAGVRYEALMDEWTTSTSDTTDSSGHADYRGFHGTYEITLSKAGETTEIHEIELVPGGSTQSFTLDTNFSGGGFPGKATSPSPANTAANVSITAGLSWTAGTDATSHDVYFGTDSTPDSGEFKGNQPGTTYDPGTLSYSTTYYWRIDEKNATGTTTGDVWSFTTVPPLPGKATSPSPANGATSINVNADISWTAGSYAASHDVYFGTDSTPDSGEFKGNQPGTTYDPGTLSSSTTYYWRIDEKNVSGTTTGDVWSFTTAAPDTTPPTPTPSWSSPPTATGPSTITMTATTATDDSPPVQYYFECTNHGEANSTWQTSTTYAPTGLTPSTLYTFRVKARDSAPALNETGWSDTASATTEPPPTDIEILGNWATGLSHAEETGTNRALIFIAHAEDDVAITLNSVTYGGQAMTLVIDRTTGTSGYRAYVAAYILDEAGVNAATSGTFVPSWSTTPENVSYGSVFLANANQTTLIGATASNSTTSSTPNPITTIALSTADGDIVIDAAVCGNAGDYTLLNGFTEAIEHDMSSSTGSDGYKFATGASETPSAQHTIVNRQAIIGFVVKAGVLPDTPPAAPTGLSAIAGSQTISLDWNNNSEPDLAGYNVYRSTTQGSDYGKLNVSLVGDSNYIDNTVTNGIPYYYVVKAVDDANNESGYSDEASATPDYQNCDDVQAGGDGLLSDLSGDCYVDYGDLAILTDYWLYQNCAAYNNCDGADFVPRDGVVDFFDFADFAIQWMWCNNPEDPDCTQNW